MLRAAVISERLVDARLAVEAAGGVRCASPRVAAYLLCSGSTLVRDELRTLVRRALR